MEDFSISFTKLTVVAFSYYSSSRKLSFMILEFSNHTRTDRVKCDNEDFLYYLSFS